MAMLVANMVVLLSLVSPAAAGISTSAFRNIEAKNLFDMAAVRSSGKHPGSRNDLPVMFVEDSTIPCIVKVISFPYRCQMITRPESVWTHVRCKKWPTVRQIFHKSHLTIDFQEPSVRDVLGFRGVGQGHFDALSCKSQFASSQELARQPILAAPPSSDGPDGVTSPAGLSVVYIGDSVDRITAGVACGRPWREAMADKRNYICHDKVERVNCSTRERPHVTRHTYIHYDTKVMQSLQLKCMYF